MDQTVPPMLDGDVQLNQSFTMDANVAVAPFGVLRGWALLSLAASGKTKVTLENGLRKVLDTDGDIHEVLYACTDFQHEIIRLYADFPRDSSPVMALMQKMIKFYGEKPGINPLRRLCFSCDHDGMRSIYEINRDFALSSHQAIRYVVREEDAPCRRAITCLVSSTDCTFYWKHNCGQLEANPLYFYDNPYKDPRGKTVINTWVMTDEFRVMNIGSFTVLQLESYGKEKNLYLISSDSDSIPTNDQLKYIALSMPNLEKVKKTVAIPCFAVATPLQLRECFNDKGAYGFNRVFDREKSILTGFLSHFHPYYPTLTTLWQYYHKALITIVDGNSVSEELAQKPLRLQVGFESRQRVELSPWIYNNDIAAECKKYHEERLPGYIDCTLPAQEMAGDIVFDKPFYFMLVNYGFSSPLIQCLGRFNNVDAVSEPSCEIP